MIIRFLPGRITVQVLPTASQSVVFGTDDDKSAYLVTVPTTKPVPVPPTPPPPTPEPGPKPPKPTPPPKPQPRPLKGADSTTQPKQKKRRTTKPYPTKQIELSYDPLINSFDLPTLHTPSLCDPASPSFAFN